jgi:biopolymer transport protein TolR
MAMALGGRKGGRRGHKPMSDINVTPMVDVMLVLLIIFMVTAPLLTAGVEVDLPKTKAGTLKGDDKPLTVFIKTDGSVYLQETQHSIAELPEKVAAIANQKFDTRIFVRADKAVNYGKVMEVMGALGGAGFTKVGLVTEPPQGPVDNKGRKGR